MSNDQTLHRLPIISLLQKVTSYIEHFSISGHFYSSLDKFHGIGLVADVFEKVYFLQNTRNEYLNRYFDSDTLRINLETEVEIAHVIESIKDIKSFSIVATPDDFLNSYNSVFQYDGSEDLFAANIWTADLNTNKTELHFYNVFGEAKENLDEPEKETQISELRKQITSSEDLNRIRELQNQLLKNQFVVKPSQVAPSKQFDFSGSVINIYHQLEAVSCEDIFSELISGLELLRQVFMQRAQDILFIRKGDIAGEKNIYITCLNQYYEERANTREQLLTEIKSEIGSWRINCKKTGKSLLRSELVTYLKEQKEDCQNRMQNCYPELWKIREHSGGLDTEVDANNFARMFYKRDNINYEFLEMEWRLELYNELIAENDQKQAFDPINFSPEEEAVNKFVDDIMKISNILYSIYEGKMVSLGVNKPTISIHIDPIGLHSYLDEQRNENYEKFKSYCFPHTSISNQTFCHYIVHLMGKGYFGQLPKQNMAETIAQVIGLNVGTVTNYLSKKQE